MTIDFRSFAPKTQLQNPYTTSRVEFKTINPNKSLVVIDATSDRGLACPDDGITITLPANTSAVTLKIGTFAGPVTIRALDSSGTVKQTFVSNAPNNYSRPQFSFSDIKTLIIDRGGNEAILADFVYLEASS